MEAVPEDESYYHLDVNHISLALLVLGAYFTTVNQLSYWLKERLYISSALISACLGIAFGPYGANIINPLDWVNNDVDARNNLTFQLTRILIGIQVMFAGISLPAAYLRREALSLAILLLPIMTVGWFISAGFIKLFIPALTYLEALAISACVTPTDPILANAIVQGRYAEKHVPRSVRNIISAESGANDGLGYPFLFLAIGLMHRNYESMGTVIGHWVVTTWLYQIGLACAIGGVLGYVARKSLKEAHTRQLIDHESFLAYGIGLAFLTLGIVGVLGSDDVLACFVAGNSLTWRDFVRVEQEDETFQDVVDSLLNVSIFIYIGTILPWSEYSSELLTPWKMVLLAICLLLFRRLPWVMALHHYIPAIPSRKQAIFTGWFGPMGVSALYYAILAEMEMPASRTNLRAVITPIVLFIAFSSTVVHGITIPLTKFGPRVITRTKSTLSVMSGKNKERDQAITTNDISGPIDSTRMGQNSSAQNSNVVLPGSSDETLRKDDRDLAIEEEGRVDSGTTTPTKTKAMENIDRTPVSIRQLSHAINSKERTPSRGRTKSGLGSGSGTSTPRTDLENEKEMVSAKKAAELARGEIESVGDGMFLVNTAKDEEGRPEGILSKLIHHHASQGNDVNGNPKESSDEEEKGRSRVEFKI